MINFNTKAKDFTNALSQIDLNKIEALAYPLQYAKHTLQHKEYFVSIYANCLNYIYKDENKFENDILVDFGCGNGFLALFASFCGCKNVVAVEVREEFVFVAKQIQQHLEIKNIIWLVGNEQTLINHFADKPKPSTLIASDVIEHIYNLQCFFNCLRQLQLSKLVFTTGSVHDNIFKRKQLYKLMYQDENVSNTPLHVSVESNYGSLPYMQVRQLIIKELYPKISNEICKQLATNTRGFNKVDIIKEVDKYLYTKKLPKSISHPYNTCDPITGSFTERILTIQEYKTLFIQGGFELSIINGNYNSFGSGIKTMVLKLVNGFINLFSKNYIGRCVCPSVYLVGERI